MEFELKYNHRNFTLEITDNEIITEHKIEYLDTSKDFKNYSVFINPKFILKIGNLLYEMIEKNCDEYEYELFDLTYALYKNLSHIDKQNFKAKIEDD
jgi:hypothetical protein